MASRIPQFFKQLKPRSFNYRPVFYDRRKEILNERVKEGLKGDLFVPSIHKGSFREYHSSKHPDLRRKSNVRLLVIVILIIFVTLLIIIL